MLCRNVLDYCSQIVVVSSYFHCFSLICYRNVATGLCRNVLNYCRQIVVVFILGILLLGYVEIIRPLHLSTAECVG